MTATELPDLQASRAETALALDSVGIVGLRHPIVVLDRRGSKQETIADLSMSVDLSADQRGAHLSRFLEVLTGADDELTVRTAANLLREVRQSLGTKTAHVSAAFTYFVEKRAPVTGARGLLDVACRFDFSDRGDGLRFVMEVRTPVTTLCPCSRAVSDYGAHNQRCEVTIAVAARERGAGDASVFWIEELVEMAERHGSAPIYPALKRPDERFVTMQAYDNPVFVEDVVRGVATELQGDTRVESFVVEASSDESIHNHRAFARIGHRS